MNTLEVIAKRVSVRKYQPKQIPEEALQKILKAGMAAPVASAKYDSLHIAVVQTEEILKQIADATSDFISKIFGYRKEMDFGAKTLVIISGAAGMVPGIEYASAGCIAENMLLAATDMGIDNIVWAGAAAVIAQSEELKKKLGIPDGMKPLLCASFGYAANGETAKDHEIAVSRV